MKKILLILVLWCGFAQAQTPPGYTLINQRYEWLAGIFKGLGLPSGATPAFSAGQAVRDGAVFCDTVETAGSPRGLYIWTDGQWVLQGNPVGTVMFDDLLSGGEIVYSGTGLTFNIQPATYRINNQIHSSPAGSFTLAAADPDFNRQDVVYLGTDNNFHVLTGTPATPAAIPQVDGDQLALTSILVPAGSTTPGITTTVIYNENTEGWVWSQSATTIDPNNTTNVWIGSISANLTNIVHGGYVELTKTIGTVSISGVDALSLFIKLKQQVPTLSEIWVSLWNGTAQLTTEIKLAYDKNNITTYQGVSIPIGYFGIPASYSINKIRFRWRVTGANPNYQGWYTDYVHFVDDLAPPGSSGNVALSMPSPAFQVSGSPGANISVTMPGPVTDYLRANGTTAAFPTLLNKIGILDGRAKVADGLVIDTDSLYAQTVDYTYPGLATPAMKMKWDSAYYITPLSSLGDSLIRPVNDSTTGVKSLVAGTGVSLTDTDSTVIITATAAASRFGFAGEDDVAAEDRSFAIGANDFLIHKDEGGGTTSKIEFGSNSNLVLESADGGDVSSVTVAGIGLAMHSPTGYYSITNMIEPGGSTNKMVLWDSVNNFLRVTAIPAGGGGTVTDVLGTTNRITSTGGTTPDIDISATFEALLLKHTTTDPALTTTTASGTGNTPTVFDIYVRSDETLVNSATDQPLFSNTAHDIITVQANTTYEFTCTGDFTHGAVSHSIAFGLVPTTAVVTNIAYNSRVWVTAVGTTTATDNKTRVKSTATTAINLAGANATESFELRGWITIGATGGTLVPTIKFSSDPTGVILLKEGAEFHIWAKGNNTYTQSGPIN